MGTDLAVDGSGNTYVTGEFRTTSVFAGGEAGETTLTSDGDSDMFVAKYAVDGDLIWANEPVEHLVIKGVVLPSTIQATRMLLGPFKSLRPSAPEKPVKSRSPVTATVISL